jgi:membrane fusion protein, multidrug efflux system
MFKPRDICIAFLGIALPLASQQSRHVEMTSVETRAADRTVSLPAELQPYLQAEIEARVPGYIERVLVDRGSEVKRGQLLVELSAPELAADTALRNPQFTKQRPKKARQRRR